MRHRRRLPCPVISIGNITVGGTGKTPAALSVSEECLRRGFSPVVLTRGYRGRVEGPCVVSPDGLPHENFTGDPQKVIHAVKDTGDEPLLLAERLKGVPVIKSRSRYEGGIFALNSFSFPVSAPVIFVLDDGFQHWGLHRDVDIVLLDGLHPFGSGKLLPFGRLRGPLGELRDADIFTITGQRNESLADELRGIWPDKPVYFSDFRMVRARNRASLEVSPDGLRDKRAFAFCGIAHPESFRRTLLSIPTKVAGMKAYGDHHFYTPADVHEIETLCRTYGCDLVLTTEKDMVKLKSLSIPDTVFSLEMTWRADEGFYDDVFKRISN